jgi:LDH2 family malate/lactate/ureidoglycolate dehydrogenase
VSVAVQVPVAEARAACEAALVRLGAAEPVARRVAEDLLRAELEGYPSHGLLRTRDYADAIAAGELDPRARPQVEALEPGCARVGGRRCFGVLAADAVVETLGCLLEEHALAAVSLVDAGHLGRVAHVVAPLAEDGHVGIGFVNFLGAGQRVAPPGRTEPRLCTNPIAVAAPRREGPPLVVDASTSAVAEGAVRTALLQGEEVPPGWLLDRNGDWSRDPAGLYATPPSALLAPLGGPAAAHKGFALALACEVLAGIVTGAGHARPDAAPGGNGGLFLGLRGGAFGIPADEVAERVESLLGYCDSSAAAGAPEPLRVPGERRNRDHGDAVTVAEQVWEDLDALARD